MIKVYITGYLLLILNSICSENNTHVDTNSTDNKYLAARTKSVSLHKRVSYPSSQLFPSMELAILLQAWSVLDVIYCYCTGHKFRA